MRKLLTSKWTKIAVFLVSSIPFVLLSVGLLRNDLGINPVETLQHTTGDWTLRFLVFTLAITPLRKVFQLPELIRYRRMLGLFAFFYVVLHFITYLGPDQSFNLSGMWDDVAKRKFVTVGFAAFLLLIPLAITSTSGMIRRLGGKRWQALHRLVYVSAILGVIHYYWLVKSDVRKPLFYGALVGILLLWRVWDSYFRGKGSAPVAVRPSVRSAS
ncbi:MAG TPA: protein-methionine-sulfoxide reductase heme-binding subunit MsrQ [Candidatus Acidoferrum sp.]|nr:protein-methionine-sulfoxide reductase heme-binding subunit MsrQ [Candidatus Acidoferrum sp.]